MLQLEAELEEAQHKLSRKEKEHTANTEELRREVEMAKAEARKLSSNIDAIAHSAQVCLMLACFPVLLSWGPCHRHRCSLAKHTRAGECACVNCCAIGACLSVQEEERTRLQAQIDHLKKIHEMERSGSNAYHHCDLACC